MDVASSFLANQPRGGSGTRDKLKPGDNQETAAKNSLKLTEGRKKSHTHWEKIHGHTRKIN